MNKFKKGDMVMLIKGDNYRIIDELTVGEVIDMDTYNDFFTFIYQDIYPCEHYIMIKVESIDFVVKKDITFEPHPDRTYVIPISTNDLIHLNDTKNVFNLGDKVRVFNNERKSYFDLSGMIGVVTGFYNAHVFINIDEDEVTKSFMKLHTLNEDGKYGFMILRDELELVEEVDND